MKRFIYTTGVFVCGFMVGTNLVYLLPNEGYEASWFKVSIFFVLYVVWFLLLTMDD